MHAQFDYTVSTEKMLSISLELLISDVIGCTAAMSNSCWWWLLLGPATRGWILTTRAAAQYLHGLHLFTQASLTLKQVWNLLVFRYRGHLILNGANPLPVLTRHVIAFGLLIRRFLFEFKSATWESLIFDFIWATAGSRLHAVYMFCGGGDAFATSFTGDCTSLGILVPESRE